MKRTMVTICVLVCMLSLLVVAPTNLTVLADAMDKGALYTAISDADKLPEELYNVESWSSLEIALFQAKMIYYDNNTNQNAIDTARTNLLQAINNLQTVTNEGILTNNPFTSQTDLENYPITIRRHSTTVSYDYVAGETNAQIMTNDPARTKLIGGDVLNNNNNYIADSSWSPGNNMYVATVIFQFEEPCYINRVDLWTRYTRSSLRQMDYFDVEVSVDGMNYNKVTTANNNIHNTNIDFSGYVNTIANFDLVKAKYVKIKAHHRAGSYQLVLGEVVIMGYPVPFMPTVDYDFSFVGYYDMNDNRIETLTNATDIIINAIVSNKTYDSTALTVISVLYNPDGGVEAIDFVTQDVAPGENESFSLHFSELPENINNNYTIRTFAVKSLLNSNPITRVRSFGNNDLLGM